MRTLAGWIVGIFSLGLVLGGLYRGISAEEAEANVANLPSVDCGEGREALFEPVTANGTTTLRVKCVATAEEPASRAATPSYAAPAAPAYAPAPAPVAAPAPVYVTAPVAPAPVTNVRNEPAPEVRERESRSWKDSALIIGSSAGAGAGIGALAKGKKGAIVGAAVGGVAGTVYDLSTRNK